MQLVKLSDVEKMIDSYKREVLETMGDIKANNVIDEIFKKYFEEIIKATIDLYFDNLRYRIESRLTLFEDIDSIADRLEISKDKLKDSLKARQIENTNVVNIEIFEEEIADALNLKVVGDRAFLVK